jgi:hypothetical protein
VGVLQVANWVSYRVEIEMEVDLSRSKWKWKWKLVSLYGQLYGFQREHSGVQIDTLKRSIQLQLSDAVSII